MNIRNIQRIRAGKRFIVLLCNLRLQLGEIKCLFLQVRGGLADDCLLRGQRLRGQLLGMVTVHMGQGW
jgi:hypothetical protein